MENEYRCPSCDPSQPSFPSYQASCLKHGMPVKYNIPGGYPHHMSHSSKSYTHHMPSVDKHYPGRLPGYPHQSPEFKQRKSDSMLVRGHDSHSQMYRDVDHIDTGPPIREEGVPPHVAIMRDIPRYNMNPELSLPSHMPKDTMFMQPNNHRPVDRPQLKLEMPNPHDLYNRQRSEFMSPSPTPTTPSTPLYQLEKMTNDTQFKSNKGFHKVLKGEGEYFPGQSIAYGSPECYPQQLGPLARNCNYTDGSGSSSSQANSKVKCNGPQNTFPMRLKTNSQQLSKSASEPNNMKHAECASRRSK